MVAPCSQTLLLVNKRRLEEALRRALKLVASLGLPPDEVQRITEVGIYARHDHSLQADQMIRLRAHHWETAFPPTCPPTCHPACGCLNKSHWS